MRVRFQNLETSTACTCLQRSNRVLPSRAILANHTVSINFRDNSKSRASAKWSKTTLRTTKLPLAFPATIPKANARTVAASATNDAAAIGVVIVDHGSKKKTSNDMLLEFVDVYK